MIYDIYTDGSCTNNNSSTASAGWSFVVCKHNTKNIIYFTKGKLRKGKQLSDRAELEALLKALIYTKEHKGIFYIYTDSLIVESGINGKSKRSANRDIWIDIERLCKDITNVLVKHIKAHQNNNTIQSEMNKCADKLAKQASFSLLNFKQEECAY